MVKYPAGALQADAQYTPALRALYQGNPWIEALPDSLFDADLFHALHKKIPYHANERTLDCHTRKECIQALPHVFIPMGKTGEIARKIDAAIREGYVGRNPLDSCWNRQMGQLQSCIHHRDSSFISIPGYNARASGFCLVGDSGMGKTSTINHTLAYIPKCCFIKLITTCLFTMFSWFGCVWNVRWTPVSRGYVRSFLWSLIASREIILLLSSLPAVEQPRIR